LFIIQKQKGVIMSVSGSMSLGISGLFLYDPNDVSKFLLTQYALEGFFKRDPIPDIENLRTAFNTNPFITQFHLGNVKDLGLVYLALALRKICTIESLVLLGPEVQNSGLEALSLALSQNTYLRELSFYGGMDRESLMSGFNELFTSLAKASLTRLCFSGCRFNAEILRSLNLALRENRCLTSLVLSDNQIDSQGALEIASALRGNPILTDLYLSWNAPFSEEALFELIRNTALVQLALSTTSTENLDQAILPRPADRIASALEIHPALTSLELSGQGIFGNQGVMALALVLERNTTLTSLGLGKHEIAGDQMIMVVPALEKNTTLQTLDLSSSDDENTDDKTTELTSAEKIAQEVHHNECLRTNQKSALSTSCQALMASCLARHYQTIEYDCTRSELSDEEE
jgi:hypothetical protein